MSSKRPGQPSFLQHPLTRYTLLQVPGWLLLGSVLYIVHSWGWLGGQSVFWVALVWLIKDVALYPLYRPALMRPAQQNVAESLLGATGTARTDVAESGLVLVRGEFWRACSAGAAIAAGNRVQVCGARGRVLVVCPVETRSR
ncbi:NfeD family protein [Aquisalimonas asiatica]|uniref:NfeD-like C-terminal, partner-binding n=1 Tax=Aquisalimonas asiatica TaxID=406100 RepID=A0A1H8QUA0_9GAMM|nr:NfeD family protein [Aquisalimonas asiatica]SEO57508.1 NfeD-like C-terminal, partner-binding [Aquisalimonas asiatica]